MVYSPSTCWKILIFALISHTNALNQLSPPINEMLTTRGSVAAASLEPQMPLLATRSGFLQSSVRTTAAVGLASGGGFLWPPSVAHADVASQLASKTALRNVKSAQRKLLAMDELYIQTEDYLGLKQSLRVEPFSVIRKSCVTLVRAVSEDEDKPSKEMLQKQAELENLYKQFSTSLEKMDSIAGVALRGRNLSNGEMNEAYQATVEALASFVSLAQPPMEQTVETLVE